MSESTIPLEDLVMDASLPPEERGRDVIVRFPLYWTHAPRGQITRVLALGLMPRAQRALSNLSAAPVISPDVQALIDGLRTISGQLAQAASERIDEGPISDALEENSADIERDRLRWKEALQVAADARSEREGERLMEAMDAVSRGVATTGEERTSIWTAAATSLAQANEAMSQACVSACLGFLHHRLGRPQEAEQVYLGGILEGVRRRDVAFVMCSRQMAYVQSESGRHQAALDTVEKAIKIRPDGDAMAEAARYAFRAGDRRRSRDWWVKALRVRPLCMFDLLCEANPIDPDLVDIALGIQREARQQAEHSLAAWEETKARVDAAEIKLGADLELPVELRRSIRSPGATADIAQAWTLAADAETRSRTLLDGARQAISMRAAVSRAELEAARQTLEAVQKQRDDALASLMSQRDQTETQAREAMQRALIESGLQRGCTISAGLGCGLMAVYIVASIFVAGIGPTTTAGKVMLGVIGLPVIVGAIFQVLAGLRKAALETQMMRQILDAQSTYARSKDAIAASFGPKLIELTDQVGTAQKSLSRAEEAKLLLR